MNVKGQAFVLMVLATISKAVSSAYVIMVINYIMVPVLILMNAIGTLTFVTMGHVPTPRVLLPVVVIQDLS
uniref:Putative secreted protein n=1 Tax=Panstrongylus lignarius TaxID=156445 RepID=A0A224Y6L5_9HEMI